MAFVCADCNRRLHGASKPNGAMNTTTVRKRRQSGGNRWFDLPHGGVLQIRRNNLTPDGHGLDLEVIVVDGRPRWLWMLESGEALGFVEAGEA